MGIAKLGIERTKKYKAVCPSGFGSDLPPLWVVVGSSATIQEWDDVKQGDIAAFVVFWYDNW